MRARITRGWNENILINCTEMETKTRDPACVQANNLRSFESRASLSESIARFVDAHDAIAQQDIFEAVKGREQTSRTASDDDH